MSPNESQMDLITGAEYKEPLQVKVGRRKSLSRKQKIILHYLSDHETIDTDKAVELVGGDIYFRARRRYVGLILSRMVKGRCLVRVKPGLFRAPKW